MYIKKKLKTPTHKPHESFPIEVNTIVNFGNRKGAEHRYFKSIFLKKKPSNSSSNQLKEIEDFNGRFYQLF